MPSASQPPPIRGAIFDMDGLLIDSEPHWRAAEIQVLRPLGVPLTEDMCLQTMGLRIDEVVDYWMARYPWRGPSIHAVALDIVEHLIERVRQGGQPMPGAAHAVRRCQARGLPLALATSAPRSVIQPTLDAIGLGDAFDVTCSAEEEALGKPHPAVYLTAASQLGVSPLRCLAFEDSVNGLVSACAARMVTIAVPDPAHRRDPRYSIATETLTSLEDVDEAWLSRWISPGPGARH